MLDGSFDYTNCPDCGTSVAPESLHDALHRCDGRHRDAHAEELAIAEAELFELELGEYLATPAGRFAVYCAARDRNA